MAWSLGRSLVEETGPDIGLHTEDQSRSTGCLWRRQSLEKLGRLHALMAVLLHCTAWQMMG
jgi:hypothetical protein